MITLKALAAVLTAPTILSSVGASPIVEARLSRERLFDSFTLLSIWLYWLLLTAVVKACFQLAA